MKRRMGEEGETLHSVEGVRRKWSEGKKSEGMCRRRTDFGDIAILDLM